MRHFILITLLFLSVTFTSCGQNTFEHTVDILLSESVPQITVEELQTIQDQVLLLDTRQPKEYDISHLSGARFVDYDGFDPSHVSDIPKDTPVVVYCTVGYRSEKIGEKLQKLGFANVKNLYGGIFDWKNKNNVVVNAHGQPTDSVHTYNESWSIWLKNGTKVYE